MTDLTERLAYCLRAHMNAAKQGRTLSDTVLRMSADALNDYDAGDPPRPVSQADED